MRNAFFFAIAVVMIVVAASRVKAPADSRFRTLQRLKPAFILLAQQLPLHAKVGLINTAILDDDVLTDVRWLLFPRTVERTLNANINEWDTLLIMYPRMPEDTVAARVSAQSRVIFSLADSTIEYRIVIPNKPQL